MTTPIRTRKVSHVLLHVSDIERSVKFYTDILGFKESDRNQLGMVFLRNGTDHHTFGLVPGPKDATLAPLLVAASLASLVRVFSLAVPRYPFFATPETNSLNTIPWLALVSVPLLVSIAAVAYVQRLRPRDLGLAVHRWPEIVQQTAIALTGIPLGLVEFFILRPAAWIAQLTFGSLVLGGLVIFFATGFSEELIFRAILLTRAVEGLGTRGGLLYVTVIFASLHIFFLNGIDLVFVFAVGVFYGFVVLATRNLWGVILSHSLGNVILYLVAPFIFNAIR